MRETYVREEFVDGVGPWHWLVGENGVWEGPVMNWPDHKKLWYSKCKQFRSVVQAGGALGMYPKLLSRDFEKVFTFEPDPTSYQVLIMNIGDCPNIKAHNFALGPCDSPGYLDTSCEDNVGMHTISAGVTDCPINFTTIDGLGLNDLDFIQLDVEGFELNALYGAKDSIRRCLPVISCERAGSEIAGFLSEFGYVNMGTTHADTTFAVP